MLPWAITQTKVGHNVQRSSGRRSALENHPFERLNFPVVAHSTRDELDQLIVLFAMLRLKFLLFYIECIVVS